MTEPSRFEITSVVVGWFLNKKSMNRYAETAFWLWHAALRRSARSSSIKVARTSSSIAARSIPEHRYSSHFARSSCRANDIVISFGG